MWSTEHSITVRATPEAIWPLYSDIAQRKRWETDLEALDLDGPFVAGVSGTLQLANMPPMPITFTVVEPFTRIVDETRIAEAGILVRFTHQLEAISGGGTRVTHRLEVEGDAADEIGPQIAADLPETLARLAAVAERSRTTA